jgi:two-component system OmpR family response regulator
MARVLIVEDDPSVAAGLVRGLRGASFEVELATDGTAGARLALTSTFDAILLDLMLPGHSGFDVLEALSGRRSIPVIVLTARTELPDRLKAFSLGAVDFVPKPFWVEEVIARIRAHLHAPHEQAPARIVRFADAAVDLDARTVEVAGAEVTLTRFEFDLLAYLVQRPGRAITRQQLAQRALSPLDARSERTVDSHITRLRKKLGVRASASIVTVWSIGYRFEREGRP